MGTTQATDADYKKDSLAFAHSWIATSRIAPRKDEVLLVKCGNGLDEFREFSKLALNPKLTRRCKDEFSWVRSDNRYAPKH